MTKTQQQTLKPFLKWVGGKRQLLPTLRKYTPRHIRTYYEPFVGAGAMLLELRPQHAVVNDLNSELINCYQVIQHQCTALIELLKTYENTKENFYDIRALDRQDTYHQLSPLEKAARTIYLNKTCFNGLYRVNRKGQFNAPYGYYKNPNIINEDGLKTMSQFLKSRQIQFLNTDFENCVKQARWGDFVYFDPPYDPLSETSSFTAYQNDGFGRGDQERLKMLVDELTRRGCKVMLSNSYTNFIRSLYKNYYLLQVSATRRINSVASGRGKISEILVLNYHPETGEMVNQHARETQKVWVA